jgi:hypothetical protein
MPVVAEIFTREYNAKPETIEMMTTRPPTRPMPLSLLMGDIEKSINLNKEEKSLRLARGEFGRVEPALTAK